MQDSDSMDTFWLWLEQQEEQQMCDCKRNVKVTPHKHAGCIRAWLDGIPVQLRMPNGDWKTVNPTVLPLFLDSSQYRIKPEPATDLEQYGVEVGDVWVTETGTPFLVTGVTRGDGGLILLDTQGVGGSSEFRMDYTRLRAVALEHDKLLFRRGVINRLSEV